jgi:hypothetical protein
MLTPMMSACEYAKKSRRKPCAHSVQTYVASSKHLSKEKKGLSPPRTTSPLRRSATSPSCATTSSPHSNPRGSSQPRRTCTRASPSCSRPSFSQRCTRASRELRYRGGRSSTRAWRVERWSGTRARTSGGRRTCAVHGCGCTPRACSSPRRAGARASW